MAAHQYGGPADAKTAPSRAPCRRAGAAWTAVASDRLDLVHRGDLLVLWSNPLVGSITTLALIMLFWPLIAKAIALVRAPKEDEFASQRPVD